MKPIKEILKDKKIRQIANSKLVKAPPEINVKSAVDLMKSNKSGYVVIADHQSKVKGIFTETDLVRRVLGNDKIYDQSVEKYMTSNPLVLSFDDSIVKAIDLMGTHHFYHIPLVDQEEKLVGILSVRTLIRFLAAFFPNEVYNLPPSVNKIVETQEGG